jgi:hypothetical protein
MFIISGGIPGEFNHPGSAANRRTPRRKRQTRVNAFNRHNRGVRFTRAKIDGGRRDVEVMGLIVDMRNSIVPEGLYFCGVTFRTGRHAQV